MDVQRIVRFCCRY